MTDSVLTTSPSTISHEINVRISQAARFRRQHWQGNLRMRQAAGSFRLRVLVPVTIEQHGRAGREKVLRRAGHGAAAAPITAYYLLLTTYCAV
jgi:hypothetical protein